ncbi:MAG: FkbM family methyltransferase [Hyphomicrobium sp.]|nr:FkbM family methyltransferase [Hyphomicrobium sp.]
MAESEPPFGVYQPTAFEGRLIALGHRLEPTRFGKRVASFIRSTLRRLRTDPVDLEVIGQKMRLHADNNACEKRLMVTPQFFDPFDPAELSFLMSQLHPSFVFLDIGSNVGAYSVFVAKNAGPGARVLAVDPNEIVLKRLAFNAAANGLSNIQAVQAARGGKTLLKVPVRTLARLVSEAGFGHVDAIKIDVEGCEDKVLIPYFRDVPRNLYPRAVILEANVGSWQNDLLEVLASAGYQVSGGGRKNRIYRLPSG